MGACITVRLLACYEERMQDVELFKEIGEAGDGERTAADATFK